MGEVSATERYIELWFKQRIPAAVSDVELAIGAVGGKYGEKGSFGGTKYFENLAKAVKAVVLSAADEALAHFADQGLLENGALPIATNLDSLIENVLKVADSRFQVRGYETMVSKSGADLEMKSIYEAVRLKIELALAMLSLQSSTVPDGADMPSPPIKKKRGRPPKWEWPSALAALADYDSMNDVIAPVANGEALQSALEQWLLKWFSDRHNGNHPSESDIRTHISGMVQQRREAAAAKAEN
ncbi:MAG: hypothetical protein AB7G25_06750 [Sphingomonadaceae bacterium]